MTRMQRALESGMAATLHWRVRDWRDAPHPDPLPAAREEGIRRCEASVSETGLPLFRQFGATRSRMFSATGFHSHMYGATGFAPARLARQASLLHAWRDRLRSRTLGATGPL